MWTQFFYILLYELVLVAQNVCATVSTGDGYGRDFQIFVNHLEEQQTQVQAGRTVTARTLRNAHGIRQALLLGIRQALLLLSLSISKAKSAEEHPDRHIQYGAQLKALTALTKAVAAEKIRRAKKAQNPDVVPTQRASDLGRREMLRDDKVRAFYRLGRELLRELMEGTSASRTKKSPRSWRKKTGSGRTSSNGALAARGSKIETATTSRDDDEEGAPEAEAL
ncbi:hypothetical protein L596_025993 [Steinernema carpocapsae]|uniref:Uncharacterized protein n=1 Tax=Steinernema carpocapsae TaxID=34508 RepID=A0A4U5LZZ6_STECR|nr:hypothetical protein L596_025993 [Steinernema carpocapsae]